MNRNDYKIALSFPIEELKNRVLDLLTVKEVSSPADTTSQRYIGDERQDEFVDVHLRLSAWKVCATLSGWNATTEFDATDTITINLTLGTTTDASRNTLLGEALRNWICSGVAHLALQIMSDGDSAEKAMEEAMEIAHQRVMMMLCASDMLRNVG